MTRVPVSDLPSATTREVAPDVGKKIVEAIQFLGSVRAVEELEKRLVILEEKAGV